MKSFIKYKSGLDGRWVEVETNNILTKLQWVLLVKYHHVFCVQVVGLNHSLLGVSLTLGVYIFFRIFKPIVKQRQLPDRF